MDEKKVDVNPEQWDQLFAPTSNPAVVTTTDADGRVNAAAFGAVVKVSHEPVALTFTVGVGRDTANNVLGTGEFVVNVPTYDNDQLKGLCLTSVDLPPGANELEHAGLTSLPGRKTRPPRVAEFPRHFECKVVWSTLWRDRLTIAGEIVAVSCDADAVEAGGSLRWETVRPATYCGGSYGFSFSPATEQVRVDLGEDDFDLMSGLRPTPRTYQGVDAHFEH